MSATEKKVAVVLVLILIAMVAAYVTTGNKPAAMAQRPGARPGRTAQSANSSAACAPTIGGGYAKTEELGKKGAKVEVLAVVPVAHGCHNKSIAELKKEYEKHPNDIHLTIVDLQGPDAAKYREKVGSPYTRILINGKYQFEVKGRKVSLEKVEGANYKPSDLGQIIEAELKKK